jgi:hypothetical protein
VCLVTAGETGAVNAVMVVMPLEAAQTAATIVIESFILKERIGVNDD